MPLTPKEWESVLTTKDADLIEQAAETLAAEALQNRDRNQMCFLRWAGTDEHAAFYAPDTEARVPGHVYSPEGLQELRVSKSCEWCFDRAFSDDFTAQDRTHKAGDIT